MVVSARGVSTEPPASAPDTGRGSVGPSDATGCGGTSDLPPDALSPSWGLGRTEPSRGAPSSSSSTIILGRSAHPPVLGTPREPPTPLGPSTHPGSRSPRRQGGSRCPLPPRARRANARCLPALYLRDRSLRRVGRREPRLLGLAAVLGGELAALSLPRALRLLCLLVLVLFLVPGPILGPELLVLWDWGKGVLDNPHPLQTSNNQG